jgi:AmmeMemoRadiSam system protein A
MQLSEEEKEVLLLAARDAIRSHFGESDHPIVNYSRFPKLQENKSGAFVTLRIHDELRGCIGYLESTDLTLFDTICKAARQAAFNDPRFRPLSIRELPNISIEISILSGFSSIENYEEIIPGTHGLLLDEPGIRALLLPQVATENNFNLQDFLTAICQKAGVDIYLWKKRKLSLKIFTALVFSEKAKKEETYEPA